MRLAIVADWLPTYGGAEHVLAALHALWPDAPLHTTVAKTPFPGPIADAAIRPDACLQRVYRLLGRHAVLLPWMPRAIERIDLRAYDVILSSSHAVGKGVIPPASARHICYCHTPMRYAWEMEQQYLNDFRLRGWLRRQAQGVLRRARRWDISTAKRVDVFIANSTTTQERIARIYGRESIVIPPPVEDRFFRSALAQPSVDRPLLAIGRLVPYKRFDLLVAMANREGLPLVIAGTGPELPRLTRMAGPTVRLLGYIPDHALPSLYASASAVLFPQHEDAGIVPMEAQACGLPVLAWKSGGVCDVVRDGATGVLVEEQTVDAFLEGLRRLQGLSLDPARIREHARSFHVDRFRQAMEHVVQRV